MPATQARTSAVALLGVPFCRPPYFLPLATVSNYFGAMNDKWTATALLIVALAIAFVGCALWRHTDFLRSQTPEAKAGDELLREFK